MLVLQVASLHGLYGLISIAGDCIFKQGLKVTQLKVIQNRAHSNAFGMVCFNGLIA